MAALKISPLPIFKDNYVWILANESAREVACVDPGSDTELLNYLEQQDKKLAYILITHHHMDHIGGVENLKKQTGAIIYGPHRCTSCTIDKRLGEGDAIHLDALNVSFQILETPGHTLDHIVYFNDEALFSGDTLFSIGCGRLFEGSPEQMFHSLSKLSTLPDYLKVYPAHEYTEANIAFAKTIESSRELSAYELEVKSKRQRGLPSLPSKLANEKSLNPFLRYQNMAHLSEYNRNNATNFTPIEFFTFIRKAKDNF